MLRSSLALVCCLLPAVAFAEEARKPEAKKDEVRKDEPKSPDLFPLKIGNAWTYKSGEGRLTMTVARSEKIRDVSCFVVEATQDGKVVGTELVAAGTDGISRYTFGGKPIDPSVLFLKLPAKVGETWTAETSIDGRAVNASFKTEAADVEVPAGKYRAFVVVAAMEIGGNRMFATTWYAQDVGMVKQVLVVGVQTIKLELEKFEPGK